MHVYVITRNTKKKYISTSPAATEITCGVNPCPALPVSTSWK